MCWSESCMSGLTDPGMRQRKGVARAEMLVGEPSHAVAGSVDRRLPCASRTDRANPSPHLGPDPNHSNNLHLRLRLPRASPIARDRPARPRRTLPHPLSSRLLTCRVHDSQPKGGTTSPTPRPHPPPPPLPVPPTLLQALGVLDEEEHVEHKVQACEGEGRKQSGRKRIHQSI